MGQLWRRTKRILRCRLASWVRDAEARSTDDPGSVGFEAELRSAPHGEHASPRARALAVLELGPRATHEEIRSSYRRLCRRYHPDRFDGDEARSRAANELLAEINAAYALLIAELGGRSD